MKNEPHLRHEPQFAHRISLTLKILNQYIFQNFSTIFSDFLRTFPQIFDKISLNSNFLKFSAQPSEISIFSSVSLQNFSIIYSHFPKNFQNNFRNFPKVFLNLLHNCLTIFIKIFLKYSKLFFQYLI